MSPLWLMGELAPTSAFAVPGIEAGAGGLSTWLLGLTLQVMLNIRMFTVQTCLLLTGSHFLV